MMRKNTDTFYDYDYDLSKGGRSFENMPERSQHIPESYHLSRHPTTSAGSSISQEESNHKTQEMYDPYDLGSESESECQNGAADPSRPPQSSHRRGRFGIPPTPAEMMAAELLGARYPPHQDRPHQPQDRTLHPQERPLHPQERPLHPQERPLHPQERPHQPALGPAVHAMPTPGHALPALNTYAHQGAHGGEPSADNQQTMGPLRTTQSRLDIDYQHQSAHGGAGGEQVAAPSENSRKRSRTLEDAGTADRWPFTCDLCALPFPDGQALRVHLEKPAHWVTMEHIQQTNKYDDNTIAFLQEAMLHKVRQTTGEVDDEALDALQEKEGLVRVLLCAPCREYVSLSENSLQNHLLSDHHRRNREEFKLKQRRQSGTTADYILQQLTPLYANFLEGKDPFK